MRNVVLLILDTVRKDYFDRNADRIQDAAPVSFEQTRAASSVSAPSHASIFTGELTETHGVHAGSPHQDYTVDETFLVELDGYETFGVSTNAFVGPPFGMGDLFDEFRTLTPSQWYPDALDLQAFVRETDEEGLSMYGRFLREALASSSPVRSLLNGAIFYLDNHVFPTMPFPRPIDEATGNALDATLQRAEAASEPFFGFVNLMEAHGPMLHTRGYDEDLHGVSSRWSSHHFDREEYNVHRSFDEIEADVDRYRSLYGAAIDYLDREVAAFLSELSLRTERETTVVITADHGEMLGYPDEERLLGHAAPRLNEALLHVPMVLVNPPGGYEPEVTDYVSHLDLGTLIAGLAAGDTPDVTAQEIPAERIRTNVSEGAVESAENPETWRQSRRCRYESDRKVVWTSTGERFEYRLTDDCKQELVSSGEGPPPAEDTAFEEALVPVRQRLVDDDSFAADLDAGTRRRLEDLGYL